MKPDWDKLMGGELHIRTEGFAFELNIIFMKNCKEEFSASGDI